MNRIKQILKGESIENLLDETILRIFGEGLIMSSDSEILSLINFITPIYLRLAKISCFTIKLYFTRLYQNQVQ